MPAISDISKKKASPVPPSEDGHEGIAAVPSLPPAEEAVAIRILLADSQAIYRVGIRKVFAIEDDMRVVAQAENFPGLLAALERFPSDIVLLDGAMIYGMSEAIPEMIRRAPNAKVVVQVSENSEDFIVDLYRRGVRGVISRSISPSLHTWQRPPTPLPVH